MKIKLKHIKFPIFVFIYLNTVNYLAMAYNDGAWDRWNFIKFVKNNIELIPLFILLEMCIIGVSLLYLKHGLLLDEYCNVKTKEI